MVIISVFLIFCRAIVTESMNRLYILFIMLSSTCFGHCGPSSRHKNVCWGKLYSVWSLAEVHIPIFQRDLVVIWFNHVGLIVSTVSKVQGVPLATEPGISLVILTPMKILQRNLNRNTFDVWGMNRNVCVVSPVFH